MVSQLPQSMVVLVHGLGAHRMVMAPLVRHLRGRFGRVWNWGYSSLWSRIEQHGERLARALVRLDEDPTVAGFHLVTHSMGGIVARLALAERIPAKLGKIVMLAPPNRGSHMARKFAPWLGRICPPLVQLSDERDSYVVSLPPPQGVPIGVIAATSDLLVAEAATHLPTERDHVVLPGMHTTLVWRRETAMHVVHFLEHGHFPRQPVGRAS
jgi:pimeloyl-ACP methyl ester carboxylesterase